MGSGCRKHGCLVPQHAAKARSPSRRPTAPGRRRKRPGDGVCPSVSTVRNLHEVAPAPQPHRQASCPLGQEMRASGLGLASHSEGELTLPVMEQGFLVLPTTCVAGPCPCSPRAPPHASIDLWRLGSRFTLASTSRSPLSTVPCHFAWFPPFVNPHPVFPVTREKETCLCLQPLLLCSVFCQRKNAWLSLCLMF